MKFTIFFRLLKLCLFIGWWGHVLISIGLLSPFLGIQNMDGKVMAILQNCWLYASCSWEKILKNCISEYMWYTYTVGFFIHGHQLFVDLVQITKFQRYVINFMDNDLTTWKPTSINFNFVVGQLNQQKKWYSTLIDENTLNIYLVEPWFSSVLKRGSTDLEQTPISLSWSDRHHRGTLKLWFQIHGSVCFLHHSQ